MSQSKDSLEVSVRVILLDDWDPIGIGDIPDAQDEYDAYAADICKILRAEKQAEVIIYNFLRAVEMERMGLDGNELRTQRVAIKLAALLQQNL